MHDPSKELRAVRARMRDLVTEVEGVHARVVERTKRSSIPPPPPPEPEAPESVRRPPESARKSEPQRP